MDIALCDDHGLVRDSMADYFEANGHRVVVRASDPSQLRDLAPADAPDVCVTDLLFASEDRPASVLPMITALAPLTDVVVLTGVQDPADLDAARRSGAVAVGSKALPCTEILALVEGRAHAAPTPDPPPGSRPFFLTEREVEVLQSLSNGDSTARMAEVLGVRQATARSHVQSVLLKLGVHSRVAAVAIGVQHGLIEVVA